MSQTRVDSVIESAVNIAIGYFTALIVQAIVFPWFGFHASATDHAAIAAIFTVVSLVRSYCVRRVFNKITG